MTTKNMWVAWLRKLADQREPETGTDATVLNLRAVARYLDELQIMP